MVYHSFQPMSSLIIQEIGKISRAVDDIPTRAELLQYVGCSLSNNQTIMFIYSMYIYTNIFLRYERRFVELYELVAEKLQVIFSLDVEYLFFYFY